MTKFVLKNLCRLFDKYAVANTENDAFVKKAQKTQTLLIKIECGNSALSLKGQLISEATFLGFKSRKKADKIFKECLTLPLKSKK